MEKAEMEKKYYYGILVISYKRINVWQQMQMSIREEMHYINTSGGKSIKEERRKIALSVSVFELRIWLLCILKMIHWCLIVSHSLWFNLDYLVAKRKLHEKCQIHFINQTWHGIL